MKNYATVGLKCNLICQFISLLSVFLHLLKFHLKNSLQLKVGLTVNMNGMNIQTQFNLRLQLYCNFKTKRKSNLRNTFNF